MANEEYNRESFIPSIGSSNDRQDFTAITFRLDTRPLLDDIELWLRGSRLLVKDVNGKAFIDSVPFGKPKANDVGIQSILALASTVFNNHFVQGNWKEQRYEDFIEEFHDSLLWNTWINLYDWGINESDYEVIVDHIVQAMIGFASRLIDNKERESYYPTMRTIESSTIREQPQKGFSLFGKKD